MNDKRKLRPETLMVLGSDSRIEPGEPLSAPIYQSTNFAVPSSAEMGQVFRSGSNRFYTRLGNPTVDELADNLARLEGAERALMFGSGMAAMTTTIMALAGAGDHAVVHRNSYGQTVTFFQFLQDQYGLDVSFVDARDRGALDQALRPETRLVVIETPSNPLLEIIDIREVAAGLADRDCVLVVDSTFATPALQRPIERGADLVVHSATKYLGGHSDVMGGVVAGRGDLVGRIRKLRASLGGILDPHAAWLIHRGLKTLGVRMQRHCENALAIAQALSKHPAVLDVRYPYLESDPEYEVAKRQMSGGGGVVSFRLREGLEAGRRFLDGLKLIPIATSLGGVETVVEVPEELDYSMDGSGGATSKLAGQPCLVRLSVGIEDAGDILGDLIRSLDGLAGEG